jgi:hypothetical protein
MLQPRVTGLRTRLWAIQHRTAALCPPTGATFPAAAAPSKEAAEASGYEVLADVCVRIDVVERVAARLRALARAAPFELELELLRLTGLGQAELIPVVEALGYARAADGRFRRCPPRRRDRRQARPPHATPLATPFAALGRIRGNR